MKVIFVCGKGGVGKTAVTAALGSHYAANGGALAISLDWSLSFKEHTGLPSLSSDPVLTPSGFYAMVLDRQSVLDETIDHYFALKPFKKWILNHPLYSSLSAVVPGLREILLMDKIFHYASPESRYPWQTVIVDMPSSGFSSNLFAATDTISGIITHGPLHQRFKRNQEYLRDPSISKLFVVALPEETPIRETREMILDFQNRGEMAIDTLLVNQVPAEPLSDKTYNWLKTLSDNELQEILTNVLKVDIDSRSMRNVAQIVQQRFQQANHHIQNLTNWWQEPVLKIPYFLSSKPQEISLLTAERLIEINYEG